VPQAIRLLQANLKQSGHRFWAIDLGFRPAVQESQQYLRGHQQITDAYLLGLAVQRKGKLATLDESLPGWLPQGSPIRDRLEIIAH
jgi:hypothetical protein